MEIIVKVFPDAKSAECYSFHRDLVYSNIQLMKAKFSQVRLSSSEFASQVHQAVAAPATTKWGGEASRARGGHLERGGDFFNHTHFTQKAPFF